MSNVIYKQKLLDRLEELYDYNATRVVAIITREILEGKFDIKEKVNAK